MGKLLTSVKENLTTETVCIGVALLGLLVVGILGIVVGIRDQNWAIALFGIIFAALPIVAVLDKGNADGVNL